MRGLSAMLALLLIWAPARAQLRDVEFTVPKSTTPETFTDKAVFVAPATFPEPKKDAPPWSGGFEFGVNGNEGNSNVLKLRLGTFAKRHTADNIFTTDLVYGLARQGGETNENKALWNARDEVFLRGGPWGLFAATQVEYDEFRNYDYRFAGHLGFAYQFLRADHVSLRGRIGAGVSRELGETDSKWVPEGLVGLDVDWKLTSRQRFIATADYYPDLGRPDRFRVRARAAYEVLLDEKGCLTLRLGVQERFDSNPGPETKQNDLDYFTTLVFKF